MVYGSHKLSWNLITYYKLSSGSIIISQTRKLFLYCHIVFILHIEQGLGNENYKSGYEFDDRDGRANNSCKILVVIKVIMTKVE